MVQSRTHGAGDVVRAIRDYRAQYPDPLRVAAGAIVHVGRTDDEYPGWRWCTAADGRHGWVPDDLLGELAVNDPAARVRADYDATELSVTVGEVLTVIERRPDWLRVTTDDGRRGWVPATHVR